VHKHCQGHTHYGWGSRGHCGRVHGHGQPRRRGEGIGITHLLLCYLLYLHVYQTVLLRTVQYSTVQSEAGGGVGINVREPFITISATEGIAAAFMGMVNLGDEVSPGH
jgi:hypothetical protein